MILLGELIAATGGKLCGTPARQHWAAFAHDSRSVSDETIFVAMRTRGGDGHAFAGEAIANGAGLIICERPPPGDCPYLLVADSAAAIRKFASWAVAEYAPAVIAIAGSVGKTTTRDFIYQLFSGQRLTFRSAENFNDLTGLPLALGQLGREHAYAVLEMASDQRGELAALARIAPPNTLVLTGFDETYIEYFGSRAAIVAEHAELVATLGSTGLLVYPAEDPAALKLAAGHRGPKISYGLARGDVRGDELQLAFQRTRFQLVTRQGREPIDLPLLGQAQTHCLLAAIATALRTGLDLEGLKGDMERLSAPPGRLQRLPGRDGLELLDDSFSTSPASLTNALCHLRRAPGRRICVLAGFEHLGEHARVAAQAVADDLAKTDEVVLYGADVDELASAARDRGMSDAQIHRAFDYQQARLLVEQLSNPGDAVLIKGGPGARLEHLTAQLLADPELAATTLCRQTRIWRNVVTLNPDGPVWVQIDVDAIARNTFLIGESIGSETAIIAVLKADGYGHGSLRVATSACSAGAMGVAVARANEASALRRQGYQGFLLVLGITLPRQVRPAVLADCALTVCDKPQIEAIAQAAKGLGKVVKLHLKIDTGMGRIGARPAAALSLAKQIAGDPNVKLGGVYTHFGRSSSDDEAPTMAQLASYEGVLEQLTAASINPGLRHCAATTAALRWPAARFDAVRIGIGLLGIDPAPGISLPPGCRPALSMHAQVIQVAHHAGGSVIGYGDRGRLLRDSTIATVAAGYGDGFRRGPESWGPVLIHGQPAAIVGNVCMDMFMADITDIESVRVGDEVVLLGPQLDTALSAEQAAQRLATIPYEVVSGLLSRVPRV